MSLDREPAEHSNLREQQKQGSLSRSLFALVLITLLCPFLGFYLSPGTFYFVGLEIGPESSRRFCAKQIGHLGPDGLRYIHAFLARDRAQIERYESFQEMGNLERVSLLSAGIGYSYYGISSYFDRVNWPEAYLKLLRRDRDDRLTQFLVLRLIYNFASDFPDLPNASRSTELYLQEAFSESRPEERRLKGAESSGKLRVYAELISEMLKSKRAQEFSPEEQSLLFEVLAKVSIDIHGELNFDLLWPYRETHNRGVTRVLAIFMSRLHFTQSFPIKGDRWQRTISAIRTFDLNQVNEVAQSKFVARHMAVDGLGEAYLETLAVSDFDYLRVIFSGSASWQNVADFLTLSILSSGQQSSAYGVDGNDLLAALVAINYYETLAIRDVLSAPAKAEVKKHATQFRLRLFTLLTGRTELCQNSKIKQNLTLNRDRHIESFELLDSSDFGFFCAQLQVQEEHFQYLVEQFQRSTFRRDVPDMQLHWLAERLRQQNFNQPLNKTEVQFAIKCLLDDKRFSGRQGIHGLRRSFDYRSFVTQFSKDLVVDSELAAIETGDFVRLSLIFSLLIELASREQWRFYDSVAQCFAPIFKEQPALQLFAKLPSKIRVSNKSVDRVELEDSEKMLLRLVFAHPCVDEDFVQKNGRFLGFINVKNFDLIFLLLNGPDIKPINKVVKLPRQAKRSLAELLFAASRAELLPLPFSNQAPTLLSLAIQDSEQCRLLRAELRTQGSQTSTVVRRSLLTKSLLQKLLDQS